MQLANTQCKILIPISNKHVNTNRGFRPYNIEKQFLVKSEKLSNINPGKYLDAGGLLIPGSINLDMRNRLEIPGSGGLELWDQLGVPGPVRLNGRDNVGIPGLTRYAGPIGNTILYNLE